MHKTEGQNLTSIVRNTLMGASMIGTAFTISNGALRLPGLFESYATAAGVAFSTDAVVTLAALRLGDIDGRIHRARKRSEGKNKREAAQASAEIADLTRKRTQTMQCFCVAGAISMICNVFYNYVTKNNLPLALLVGIVPIVMVAIVCIFLRPLPVDYDDLAKSQTKEALIEIVAQAGRKVRKSLRSRSVTPAPDLAGNIAVLGMYAESHEHYGLQQALKHTGAVVEAEHVATDRMLTSAMIQAEWQRSRRTVQNHMAQMPERSEIAGVLMVPESAYRARFGAPILAIAAPTRATRRKASATLTQGDADPAQGDADLVQGERNTAPGNFGIALAE